MFFLKENREKKSVLFIVWEQTDACEEKIASQIGFKIEIYFNEVNWRSATQNEIFTVYFAVLYAVFKFL